jgi:hypothetical protein
MIQMKKLKHFATMISYLPEAALAGKGKARRFGSGSNRYDIRGNQRCLETMPLMNTAFYWPHSFMSSRRSSSFPKQIVGTL